SLDRLHGVDERQHQGEGGGAAQPGQQPDPEAEHYPEHHEAQRLPLKDEEQSFEERFRHSPNLMYLLNSSTTSFGCSSISLLTFCASVPLTNSRSIFAFVASATRSLSLMTLTKASRMRFVVPSGVPGG